MAGEMCEAAIMVFPTWARPLRGQWLPEKWVRVVPVDAL